MIRKTQRETYRKDVQKRKDENSMIFEQSFENCKTIEKGAKIPAQRLDVFIDATLHNELLNLLSPFSIGFLYRHLHAATTASLCRCGNRFVMRGSQSYERYRRFLLNFLLFELIIWKKICGSNNCGKLVKFWIFGYFKNFRILDYFRTQLSRWSGWLCIAHIQHQRIDYALDETLKWWNIEMLLIARKMSNLKS